MSRIAIPTTCAAPPGPSAGFTAENCFTKGHQKPLPLPAQFLNQPGTGDLDCAFVRAKLVAVPVSITVAVLVAACSTSPPQTQPPATKTVTVPARAPAPSSAPPPVEVGQKGIESTFAYTVKSSDTDDVVEFDESDAVYSQGIFVFVTMQVENIGRSAQTYSADYQRLVDSEGRQFSPDMRAMTTKNYVKQTRIDINPGNTAGAQLVFDVPKGTQPNQYVLLLHDSLDSHGVALLIPPQPPPRTFAPTADDDQRFLQKLASDAGRWPSLYSPIWITNPALAINVAHDACRTIVQRRHMTAHDFGDLTDLLAQRWGVENSLTGSIVTNAIGSYTNC
jgi:Domain of unknown function (DUF4352)